MPRKPASENVVCWIFLQTFQTYFCIQANSVDPDQRSSLIWVHTVCKNDFENHKQMTKQTTIVVIGSLRVKSEYIFYMLIINQWSVSFAKPMIDYEILSDSQHYLPSH